MLAAFTASITRKQQKISIRLIFSFKGMNCTEKSQIRPARQLSRTVKKHKAMNLHALPLPLPLAML
jgi:hypothetical protein